MDIVKYEQSDYVSPLVLIKFPNIIALIKWYKCECSVCSDLSHWYFVSIFGLKIVYINIVKSWIM